MQSFAEYLADRGHDVTVICEFPNHPHGVIPPEYRRRLLEDDRSNPYRILRVWVKAERREDAADAALVLPLVHGRSPTAVAPLAGRRRRRASRPRRRSSPGWRGSAIARMNAGAVRARRSRPVARGCDEPAADLRRLGDAAQPRRIERRALPLRRRGRRGDRSRSASTSTRIRGRPAADGADPERDARAVLRRPRRQRPEPARVPGRPVPRHLRRHPRDRAGAAVACSTPPSSSSGVADFAFVGDGPDQGRPSPSARRAAARERALPPTAPDRADSAGPRRRATRCSSRSPPIPTFEQFVPSKLVDFMASDRPVCSPPPVSRRGSSSGRRRHRRARRRIPTRSRTRCGGLPPHPAEAAEMGRRGRAFAARRLRSVAGGAARAPDARRRRKASPLDSPTPMDNVNYHPPMLREVVAPAPSKATRSSSSTSAAGWGSTTRGGSSSRTSSRTHSTHRRTRSNGYASPSGTRACTTTPDSSAFRTGTRSSSSAGSRRRRLVLQSVAAVEHRPGARAGGCVGANGPGGDERLAPQAARDQDVSLTEFAQRARSPASTSSRRTRMDTTSSPPVVRRDDRACARPRVHDRDAVSPAPTRRRRTAFTTSTG